MLGFTHIQKNNKRHVSLDEPDFQPIIIQSSNQKQKKMAEPKMTQKKIMKTHSNYKIDGQNINKKPSKFEKSQRRQWNVGSVNNRQGVFDRQIKKNTLAAQERQSRAESRKKLNINQKESHTKTILNKEQQIYKKRQMAYEQQKDRQIEQLKRLIEQEKQQKQKNDKAYQKKKMQIEKERRQLLQLQKRIQKQGPKAKKQHQQKLREFSPEFYPANDRAKCHQQIQNLPLNQTGFPQITQSESIANQKHKIHQKQLEYLIDQRQKNHLQYQRNTLGYTPTLIPLLSKASYRIISTHVSSLVQLFIDDIIEQQVLLLEQIQLEETQRKQIDKEKQILNDYVNGLEQFVDEAHYIQSKVGRYSKLQFSDFHKPAKKFNMTNNHGFSYSDPLVPLQYNLNLEFSHQKMDQIIERIRRYHRFVQNFAQYKPEQLNAMKSVTQQIIDQAISQLCKQLDNGAGQFVNIIFRGEFE